MSGDGWDRYRRWLLDDREAGFRLDVSRMGLPDDLIERMAPAWERARAAMRDLEAGAIANPDERRMVGHYWLRAPELAPGPELCRAIETTLAEVESFAARVRDEGRFRHALVVGIGGSALGPQLVADALGVAPGGLAPHFLDNTDPDGIDRTLAALGPDLDATLVVVISKSGGTAETRNGMLETRAAFAAHGLDFGAHAVAITQEGSKLDAYAREEGFLARFPMWDWVGGRTSVTSAVGLLPAALSGVDVRALLAGASAMDRATRADDARANPAALLALAWHHATGGRGAKDMVVLPYRDRLMLLSRYLQQLVMESLGKRLDLDGREVHQGLSVYGNKGSTDQHAYVQQLRDGLANFFVAFVEVLRDRDEPGIEVEPGATSGDFLQGFLLGTRAALAEAGRPSMTLTVDRIDAASIGALLALFERAVGFYATFVNVNAYHQPGVEAGKKAAAGVLELQRALGPALDAAGPDGATAEELARAAGRPDDAETAFHVLERLAANPGRGVRRRPGPAGRPWDARYGR